VKETSLKHLVRLHLSAVFKFDFSVNHSTMLSALRLYSITQQEDKQRSGEDLEGSGGGLNDVSF
jgi:hypothetical protein